MPQPFTAKQQLTTRNMMRIATVAAGLGGVAAFTPSMPSAMISSTQRSGRSLASLEMCICINCERVTNCAAYHFVEEQHSQPYINKVPTWEPRNGSPTIQVHIRPDEDTKAQNELGKMWDEHEDQTRQAEEASDGGENEALFGEQQYDLSGTTSYEYDVIECEDFVEDKGSWVRNMPEQIRIANPDFVPT